MTKLKTILKGDGLKNRIKTVVNEMLFDDDVTPAQINVQNVADKVPCSRTAIYINNMASVVRNAQEQKGKSVDYTEKLKKARKPKLIKLSDKIEELKKEIEQYKESLEQSERLFNRFLINVMNNSNKIGIEKNIDELLAKPIEPLEFKRHSAYAARKRGEFIDKLQRLNEMNKLSR